MIITMGIKHRLDNEWIVEIIIKGEINENTGVIVDTKFIKDILTLNQNDMETLPTSENLVCHFRSLIDQTLEKINPTAYVISVKIFETPEYYVEVSHVDD